MIRKKKINNNKWKSQGKLIMALSINSLKCFFVQKEKIVTYLVYFQLQIVDRN